MTPVKMYDCLGLEPIILVGTANSLIATKRNREVSDLFRIKPFYAWDINGVEVDVVEKSGVNEISRNI